MLYLTTARKERLEIAPASIIAVMQPCDGANPSAIIYDMGFGAQFERLADPYGIVKKSVIDCMAMVNPIEVRILEPVAEREELGEGLMFLARERIIGRREVIGDPSAVRARLFVTLTAKPQQIFVADTLDELDGIAAPKLAPLPAQPKD